MPTHERESQHTRLVRKLRAFVDCVMAQAEKDASFAAKLAEILLNDVTTTTTDRSIKRSPGKQPTQRINPVLFLKDHGEDALRQELRRQTDDELRHMLRFQGLRTSKELRKLVRTEMEQEIIAGAQAKLKQGMIVAGVTAAPSLQIAPENVLEEESAQRVTKVDGAD